MAPSPANMELKKLLTASFDKNVGTADRAFRLISGGALILSHLVVSVPTWAGVTLVVAGLMSTCSMRISSRPTSSAPPTLTGTATAEASGARSGTDAVVSKAEPRKEARQPPPLPAQPSVDDSASAAVRATPGSSDGFSTNRPST